MTVKWKNEKGRILWKNLNRNTFMIMIVIPKLESLQKRINSLGKDRLDGNH